MSDKEKITDLLFCRSSAGAKGPRAKLGVLLAAVGAFAAGQLVFAAEAWRVQAISTPAAAHSSVPRVSQGRRGSVLLSWMEPGSKGLAFRYAGWRAGKWTKAQTIAAGPELLAGTAEGNAATRLSLRLRCRMTD